MNNILCPYIDKDVGRVLVDDGGLKSLWVYAIVSADRCANPVRVRRERWRLQPSRQRFIGNEHYLWLGMSAHSKNKTGKEQCKSHSDPPWQAGRHPDADG